MAKRRRSGKRFERIPPLPANIFIRGDGKLHRGVEGYGDRACNEELNPLSTVVRELRKTPGTASESTEDCVLGDAISRSAVMPAASLPVQFEWELSEGEESTSDETSDEDYMRRTDEEVEISEVDGHLRGPGQRGTAAIQNEVLKSTISDWRVLRGVGMTSGFSKMTREQYQSVKRYLGTSAITISSSVSHVSKKSCAHHVQLPDYSAIQKNV